MSDCSFIDSVAEKLEAGFPIDDVEELFSVSEATLEVVSIDDHNIVTFFSELFSYDEDDLPPGLADYLTELDFFVPESWEVTRFTTDDDILSECVLVVTLDPVIQDQLLVDLPQFFE